MWYGWPDYTGGHPITNSMFKPQGQSQPIFLLAHHPMQPPKPITTFAPHSAIMGFDFNYRSNTFEKWGVLSTALLTSTMLFGVSNTAVYVNSSSQPYKVRVICFDYFGLLYY
ncbi:hypothetical protein ACFQZ1_20735 [Bacillus sp. CGMCC 1.60114]|uniref:hypothetical protein n=1 Tax=unclassified Bacillus (in: firmicutes) TaxID=185979 RepID=UPI00363B00E2